MKKAKKGCKFPAVFVDAPSFAPQKNKGDKVNAVEVIDDKKQISSWERVGSSSCCLEKQEGEEAKIFLYMKSDFDNPIFTIRINEPKHNLEHLKDLIVAKGEYPVYEGDILIADGHGRLRHIRKSDLPCEGTDNIGYYIANHYACDNEIDDQAIKVTPINPKTVIKYANKDKKSKK